MPWIIVGSLAKSSQSMISASHSQFLWFWPVGKTFRQVGKCAQFPYSRSTANKHLVFEINWNYLNIGEECQVPWLLFIFKLSHMFPFFAQQSDDLESDSDWEHHYDSPSEVQCGMSAGSCSVSFSYLWVFLCSSLRPSPKLMTEVATLITFTNSIILAQNTSWCSILWYCLISAPLYICFFPQLWLRFHRHRQLRAFVTKG